MTDSKIDMKLAQETIEVPPPSYDEIVRAPAILSTCSSVSEPQWSPSNSTSFKPIVIPQISSQSLRGAFMSPFTRAYAPSLSAPPKPGAKPITPVQFLHFIDGLNELLIASPGFQATSLVGNFISKVPLPIIPLFGTGIVASTGAASAATCMSRAKAYIDSANKALFVPSGLRCKVLKTGRMMLAVGHGNEVLSLPLLEDGMGLGASRRACDSYDDMRMRRIRALGDRVAELEFEGLPAPEDVDGWWKKLGLKEAQKKDHKTQAMLMQSREKGYEKVLKKNRQAEEEEARYNREIQELQQERRIAETKLGGKNVEESQAILDVEENIQRELRKLDEEVHRLLQRKERKRSELVWEGEKEMRDAGKKEQEIAQKIYWIVIDKADDGGDEVGSLDLM